MSDAAYSPIISLGGLSAEATILMLSIVLGFIQIFIAAGAVTAERGAKWNAGPRDEPMPPPGKMAARLERASKNFQESFPFFAAAILAALATGRTGAATALGAELYLIGRILYLPLYAFGVFGVRSLVWGVSLIGIILIIAGVFSPHIL